MPMIMYRPMNISVYVKKYKIFLSELRQCKYLEWFIHSALGLFSASFRVTNFTACFGR